jgi:hypothetical protein
LPITNSELAKSVIISIAVSLGGVIAVFGVLALGYLVILLFLDLRPEIPGIGIVLWAIAGCAVGSWVAMANASMLVYCRRWKSLILPTIFTLIGLPFILPLLPTTLFLAFIVIAWCLIASLCYWSYRRGVIRGTTLALCGAVAIVGALVTWQSCPIPSQEVLAAAMTLPALAILPIAGMPLAIVSSRAQ